MLIRKAKLKDVPQLYDLINQYAKEGILLPRSLSSLYESIREFWVCEEDGRVIGCASLHIVWEDLAEIKSLAVDRKNRGRGVGTLLVEACLKEAEELGVRRVFVLTYVQDFFSKFNFEEVDKAKLPHKVWNECINCIKFPSCDEIAMWVDLKKAKVKESGEV